MLLIDKTPTYVYNKEHRVDLQTPPFSNIVNKWNDDEDVLSWYIYRIIQNPGWLTIIDVRSLV